MEFSYTALFLFCATIIFLLGWIGLLPIESRSIRTHKWLLAHGQPIVAAISNIREEKRGKTNHWVIHAKWADPADGTEYRFSSAPLEFDPSVQLESGAVQVLIDPSNPRRYLVNISEIRGSTRYG